MKNDDAGVKLVAVIVAYWKHRKDNITQQVHDLLGGTVVPDKIIVFNNNKDLTLTRVNNPKVIYIDSTGNFTSRGKYAMALLEPSPYYILLDDDVTVQKTTVEKFMEHAEPGCAISNYGLRFVNNHFHKGVVCLSHNINRVEPVDAFIGACQFLSWEAIVNYLAWEGKIRLPRLPEYRSVGEDILFGLVSDTAKVIPLSADSIPVTMPGTDTQQNMQSDWGYHIFRDIFAHDVRMQLGLQLFPEDVPGGEHDERAAGEYLNAIKQRDLGLIE